MMIQRIFLKDWCFKYTAWYLYIFLLHISNSVNLFQKSTIFEFLRGFVDIRSIWFKPFNGNNKYCDTRRQIEHITLNETNDNRPMRYNKRDLYPDVFYGIHYISEAVLELYLECFRRHWFFTFLNSNMLNHISVMGISSKKTVWSVFMNQSIILKFHNMEYQSYSIYLLGNVWSGRICACALIS